MEESDVTAQKEAFMSRVFGTDLQRRFIEAAWSPQYDELMGKLMHQMLSNMDDMDQSELHDLVMLLEREDMMKSAAANTAFVLLIKNPLDGELDIWSGLMCRHFLRMNETTLMDGVHVGSNSKLSIIDALVMYAVLFPDLTVDQERALIRLTASGLSKKNPALTTTARNAHVGVLTDNDLCDLILSNEDRVGDIIKAMVDDNITRAGQIAAFLEGQPYSLAGGAL